MASFIVSALRCQVVQALTQGPHCRLRLEWLAEGRHAAALQAEEGARRGVQSHQPSCAELPCTGLPCTGLPCHAMPCNAMPCTELSCHAMPCHAKKCHAMCCHAHAVPKTCHAMPCPVDPRPARQCEHTPQQLPSPVKKNQTPHCVPCLVVHRIGRGLEHVDALHSAVVAEQCADVFLGDGARDLGDEEL